MWNVMYDGLLRPHTPEGVKVVRFADDIAVVVAAKHLAQVAKLVTGWLGQYQNICRL